MSETSIPALSVGTDCHIAETATLAQDGPPGETVIGDGTTIRGGATIYRTVKTGDEFSTGHNTLVREHCVLGDNVLVGTNAVLDGNVLVGDDVSIQTGAYVPQETELGDNVFLGPYATITNDRYPLRDASELTGAVVGDSVSIGASATVLPGVTVGRKSFVASGAVVTDDVPPETLAVGTPARHEPLPPELDSENNRSR